MMRRIISMLSILSAAVIAITAYASAITGWGLGATSSGAAKVSLWRVNLLDVNGQSLSTGYNGTCQSTSQPYANTSVHAQDAGAYYWIDGGPFNNPAEFSFIPLDCGSHGIRANAPSTAESTYPANNSGAGFAQSLELAANEWTSLKLAEGYPSFVVNGSGCGTGGQEISCLVKNAAAPCNAYECLTGDPRFATELTRVSISAATVGSPTTVTATGHGLATGNKVTITGATGMTELNGYVAATVVDANHFTVPVASTHSYTGSGSFTSAGVEFLLYNQGETDAQFATSSSDWTTALLGMLSNLQTDTVAFTGQTEQIKLLVAQQNSTTVLEYGMPMSNTTGQAVYLLAASPQPNVFPVTPEYTLPYGAGPHSTGPGYAWNEEKYAEAADAIERTGTWAPLLPVSKSVSGGTSVTVSISGGVPPLRIDHALLAPHQSGVLSLWSGALGFEAMDLTGLHVTAMTGNGVSPIAITYGGQSLSAKGVVTGDTLCVVGDTYSNAAANTCAVVTVIDDTHLSLNGTTGTGTWTAFFLTEKEVVLLPISSASISSASPPMTVSLTLGRAATTQLLIGYADTPDTRGNIGCSGGGACGLIMDSDPFIGISGTGPQDAGSYSTNPNYLLAAEGL